MMGRGGGGSLVIKGRLTLPLSPLSPQFLSAGLDVARGGARLWACINARANPHFHYLMKFFPEHLQGGLYRECSRI